MGRGRLGGQPALQTRDTTLRKGAVGTASDHAGSARIAPLRTSGVHFLQRNKWAMDGMSPKVEHRTMFNPFEPVPGGAIHVTMNLPSGVYILGHGARNP